MNSAWDLWVSQSPCGAKWLATRWELRFDEFGVEYGRNPLTGLCGLQHIRLPWGDIGVDGAGSQSPYGAKWFATYEAGIRGIEADVT